MIDLLYSEIGITMNIFIIMNKDSGNIAATVSKYKNGLVLEKEDDLTHIFENIDEMRDKINAFWSITIRGIEYLKDNRKIVQMSSKSAISGEIY